MTSTEIIVDCVTGRKIICNCMVNEKPNPYFIETFLMELEECFDKVNYNVLNYRT